MNILHIIDTTGPGGAETVFIKLAAKLNEKGHCSVAIIRGPGWVHDQLQRLQVETYIVDNQGAFNLKLLLAILRIVKEKKINLIQSHLLGANVYASIAGWISRTPVVGTFHGMVDIGINERFRLIKLWFMNRGLSATVCVSKALKDFVAENNLLNESRSHVIYNGIELQKYSKKKSSELKQKIGVLNNSSTLLGCLGNIRPAKAYPVLIHAFSLIKDKHPDVHIVIAGHQKASLMKELQELISSLELENQFHFIGYQENSHEFLSQLDLFILCSDSEGFSISTIEAMASGLPVIATRCGGPEEILQDGHDGLLVEKGNPEKLAEIIDKLLNDKNLQNELATKARVSAENRFSIEKMLQQYLKLYQTILT